MYIIAKTKTSKNRKNILNVHFITPPLSLFTNDHVTSPPRVYYVGCFRSTTLNLVHYSKFYERVMFINFGIYAYQLSRSAANFEPFSNYTSIFRAMSPYLITMLICNRFQNTASIRVFWAAEEGTDP